MFGKILRTVAAASALMLMLPMNVFAADVPAVLPDDVPVEEKVDDNVPETLTVDYYVKAEDGADGYILEYPDEGTFGYEIGMTDPADEYDFPEYKGGTGAYYTDEGQIPMTENQVLCKIEYIVSREDGSGFTGDKFYIVDYEHKSLVYVGHSVLKEFEPVQSDPQDPDALVGAADAGLTDSPETGNSHSFIAAGIAALAVMSLTKKRLK